MKCTHPNCLKNAEMFECHDDCSKCKYWTECEKDSFEISESLLSDWISYAKAEYDEDLSEDEAIEQITNMHNKGCLVEHSRHCPGCPKFGKNCPIK